MKRIQRSNAGIAEVVGAMLLIIITVVAVASFAYYLNTTQQQAQNRQSFINNVKNENLKITNIQLASYQINVAKIASCFFTGLSTKTCAFSSNVPSTDDVVVGAVDSSSGVTVTSVTDSGPNIYTKIISQNSQASAGDSELYFTPVTTAGTLTITVTWSGATNGGIFLYDVSGAFQSIPTIGNFSSGFGTSLSPSVSGFTPRANSLVIGVLDIVNASDCKITSGSGYVIDNRGGGSIYSFQGASEHGINTGTSETTPHNLNVSSPFNEVSLALILNVRTATSTSSLATSISNFTITVQNLNTASSQLVHIQVDNIWIRNFTSSGHNYFNGYPLELPAKSSANVQVITNFSSTSIFRNQTLQIVLLTGSGNYFVNGFSPPTSIISVQIATETITVQSISGGTTFTVPTVVDVPIFSGQQSQPQNMTFLIDYFWTVNFNGSTSLHYGSTVSFAYRASLDYAVLGFLPTDYPNKGGYKGNFNVILTTEDADGFTWTSSVTFPRDPNISNMT